MVAFDPSFWRGRRVLVTGHTGFKGGWLVLWLSTLGARVTGLALDPHTRPNLFTLCVGGHCTDLRGDVADREVVARALSDAAPEIVIHMAAQALVRPSYADPLVTYATNVLGTANLLQAARALPDLRAMVVVTSDKVYEHERSTRPFKEDDRLGGFDPYSASKACAELVTQSFRRSYFAEGCRVATARAGNVIGGGDWSADRIVPDMVRAVDGRTQVALRYPQAVRPWQHVLNPLSGYLLLAQALATGAEAPESVNFGPESESFRSVAELVESLTDLWGGRPGWRHDGGKHPPEDVRLTLDVARARTTLGWRPLLVFDDAMRWTADWYQAFWNGEDVGARTRAQIAAFAERLGAADEPLRGTA